MSLDVNELANRLGWSPKSVAEAATIVRAVIADEIPKHIAALLEPPKPPTRPDEAALAPQPVAEVDVPGQRSAFGWGHGAKAPIVDGFRFFRWREREDSFSRSKAEGVGVVLPYGKAPVVFVGLPPEGISQQYESLDNGKLPNGYEIVEWLDAESEISRRVAEAVAAKDKRIAELEKNLAYLLDKIPGAVRVCESGGPEDVNKSIAVSVVKLMEQLAASQAEVARLSRPVEGVDWDVLSDTCAMIVGRHVTWSHVARRWLSESVEPILQAERNAREAAETERDELREFVRTKSVWSSCFGPTVSFRLDNRGHNIPDAELDRLLAEFRAEKGKVGA